MENVMYMLDSTSNRQMNSFIVTTKEGGVIVIDGGYEFDAEKLIGKLKEITGKAVPHIDGWFFTHAHDGGRHAARGRSVIHDEIGGKSHIGQRLRRIGCRLSAREIG